MSEILKHVEGDVNSNVITAIESQGKNSQKKSTKIKDNSLNTPGALIDSIIEWENNPEYDEFWA